tara:strand:- start:2822 stop:3721 length:900 start_codon:yes stop_codon:yes gene_type:complete
MWYKGNVHTHTTKSDGDADPEVVVEWYKNHDYDFLVLSDHNHRTIIDGYSDALILIPGEEVSARILGGDIPIHLNGIGISRVVEPIDAGGVVETLQANVDLITEAGGIASLNHPNASWAYDHKDIVQIEGATLLEVYNGWPGSNSEGAPGKYSGEEIWDNVLSTGKIIYGIAVDDAHHYSDFTHTMANPGRGWIVVNAEQLTNESIIDSLIAGKFYFSTGIDIEDISMLDEGIELVISQHRDYIYNTKFIGKDGEVLKEVTGLQPKYEFSGDEEYVRASIKSSIGTRAWTQPTFLNDLN